MLGSFCQAIFLVYKIQSLWSQASQKSGRLWVLSPCLLLLPKSLRYKPELLLFSQSLITLLFSTLHYYEQLNHSSHVIVFDIWKILHKSFSPLQPNPTLSLKNKRPPGLRSVRRGDLDRRVSVSKGSDLGWMSPGHYVKWNCHLVSRQTCPPLGK